MAINRPSLAIHRPALDIHRPALAIHRPALTIHRPPPTHFVIADISSYTVIIIIMDRLNKYFITHIIAKSGTLLLIAACNSLGAPQWLFLGSGYKNTPRLLTGDPLWLTQEPPPQNL